MTRCAYHDHGLELPCSCEIHGPDLWPLVEAELRRQVPHLHGLDLHTIEAKWRAGAREHGDHWLAWIDTDFDEAIEAELIDLMCYRAMRAVANQRRGGSEAPGGSQ